MKKILVTGANSFTASHVIPYLASQGHEIQGIIRSIDSVQEKSTIRINSKFVRPNLLGDLSDSKFTETLDYRPDVILHLANNNGATEARLASIYRDNVTAVTNLISYSIRVDCPKIVALSTISVHGDISAPTISMTTGFHNPGPYGFSKREAELLLQQSEGLQSIFLLRLPSILGYGAKNHWLSTVLESALNNAPIRFNNPKAKFNNAVYVDDLSAFISNLISEKSEGVFAFPLASKDPMTIGEIVELVVEKSRSTSSLESEEVERSTFTIDDLFAREKFGYTSRTTKLAVETFVLDTLLGIK